MTAKTVNALPGRVLVSDIQRGERQIGRIILPNDNGKSSGIRSRWAEVFDVGEGVNDIQKGDWILVDHGRWTRGVKINPASDAEFVGEGVHRFLCKRTSQIDFREFQSVILVGRFPYSCQNTCVLAIE